MKIIYRADGGYPIGTGHIHRAARVLRALQARTSLNARLLVAEDESALTLARTAPACVLTLPPTRDPAAVKPKFEAGPVLEEFRSDPADIVVVDMLDTSGHEMAALCALGSPIVTLDDLGLGRLWADAIINVLVREADPQALDARTRLLEGPEFATLDPVFAEPLPTAPRDHAETGRRLFVSLGGVDAAGLCVKTARAVREIEGLSAVEFAVGRGFPHVAELDAALDGAPWPHYVHVGLPNLLDQYMKCDLAIVAGGLTMYECCRTGTPAIALCQPIDHQVDLVARLASAGAMLSLGYGANALEMEIEAAVRQLSADLSLRRELSAAGQKLVDGRGTERVADSLLEIAGQNR